MFVGIITGGNSKERPMTLKAAQDVQSILREAGIQTEIFELDNGRSLQEILSARIDLAFIIDSTFPLEPENVGLTVRFALIEAGIPYLGPSEQSFQLARDKSACRTLFLKNGIRIPKGFTISTAKPQTDLAGLSFPLILKPNTGASSIGIEVADNWQDFQTAFLRLRMLVDSIVVEEFLHGTEITVPVITRGNMLVALAPAEIEMTNSRFYDYETKVVTWSNNVYFPARLNEAETDEVRDIAIRCAKLIDTSACARVDMIISDGRPFVLEINSEPLLSRDDFVARCANASGIVYRELILSLLKHSTMPS